MTDDLTIPQFLRRELTPAEQKRIERITVEGVRPTLVMSKYDPNDLSLDWYRPKGVSLEEWATRKQAEQAKKIQRLKAIVPKAKRYGAKPADFKTRPYRWDPSAGKWVPDGEAPTKLASGLIINGNSKPAKPVRVKAPVDDFGARVATIPLGAEFKKFAQANHVWNDKYDSLNPGLQRMNVVNRLRAAIKKGQQVKWPA